MGRWVQHTSSSFMSCCIAADEETSGYRQNLYICSRTCLHLYVPAEALSRDNVKFAIEAAAIVQCSQIWFSILVYQT